jgi:hypothetical protein
LPVDSTTETFIGNDVGLPLFLSIVLVRVLQKICIFAIEHLCMLLPLDKRGRICLSVEEMMGKHVDK